MTTYVPSLGMLFKSTPSATNQCCHYFFAGGPRLFRQQSKYCRSKCFWLIAQSSTGQGTSDGMA